MSNKHNNYAFIDSQNVNLGVRSQKWNLDFARFRSYLRDKYGVTKAFLFIGYVVGNESMYTDLQEAGYIVIFKPTLEHKEGDKMVVKGNVDAELVLHTMIEYRNYDGALIVSGDGDFHCVIEYLEQQGKLFKIIVPNIHYSSLLRKYSSYIVNLSLLRAKLQRRSSRQKMPAEQPADHKN